jgi:hypothetical protein
MFIISYLFFIFIRYVYFPRSMFLEKLVTPSFPPL